MTLAFRLARRELRGGVRGLWIVVLCLALGVAVIAAVGSLRAAVNAGLAADGRALLGGDLAIDTGPEPVPGALRQWLAGQGARTSEVVQMRSILVAPPSGRSAGQRQLVDLKAVDAAWPLVGTAGIDPSQTLPAAFADHGMLVEQIVLDRLGLKRGDSVRLGTATFHIAGVLTAEPDRVATASILGPRVLISAADLGSTGLLAPGAMVRYAVRLTAPHPAAIAAAIPDRFPGQGWRVRDPGDAAPGVTRFIDQIALFLTLVGLTSLLVGGIGVANGVRAWLDARARTIATLRCLGASPALVFAVCLIQVLALACVGIVAGLLIGAILPMAASGLLSGLLPVPPVAGVYPLPLALAAGFGILIALCFALWPLGRAARIPGGALFRDGLIPEGTRPSWPLVIVNVLLGGALVALTILASGDRRFALWFCLAALATLVLFRAGGWLVMRGSRMAGGVGGPAARLGIANLHRPGAPTPLMLLSAGLGLSTLAAVALIQGNMARQIQDQLPENAPSFFFVDIQNDQAPAFEKIVATQPGRPEMHIVPSLRARVVAVKGVPVDQVKATPDTAWALRGDRGLTYAAMPPAGTRLVAGHWWPPTYDGPPLVSFDAGLAQGWGVRVGDVIRVNVLGRDVDLKVASLRDINWRTLGINFFMVASPGLLAHAPHSNIATVKLPRAEEGALLRAVTDVLPNVTGIRVRDVLGALAGLLNQVAAALSITGGVTLLAGAFVLVGAIAAGQRRRVREAVILKTLGATRAQIRAAWLTEFGILGLVAGLIAALVGSAASYGVMHYILHTDWIFLPATLIYTLMGALAIMLVFGYAGTSAALRARPAPLLRNE
ncbi:MAG TPA: FtsX-like permease family protein [Rhodopila sp.]|uniref:ABC transporter permease n=1 Tax=Rhodopila sp. TaxID=2480087 RepID=UPI002C3FC9C4|nr:FtsX-like permease family protein [Rhodopila sp.]HVY14899.1 FtsX-like permease family protein [Rhodopila sp.]